MEAVIRPARPEDAERIAALSGELGYAMNADTAHARLMRVLSSASDVSRVAEIRGVGVVGWIHGAEQCLLESEPRCEILGLVVSGSARRGGIGRALVREVENWAAQRGLCTVTVRSNIARGESHPFYEQLGYTRIKTQHVYRKPVAAR